MKRELNNEMMLKEPEVIIQVRRERKQTVHEELSLREATIRVKLKLFDARFKSFEQNSSVKLNMTRSFEKRERDIRM